MKKVISVIAIILVMAMMLPMTVFAANPEYEIYCYDLPGQQAHIVGNSVGVASKIDGKVSSGEYSDNVLKLTEPSIDNYKDISERPKEIDVHFNYDKDKIYISVVVISNGFEDDYTSKVVFNLGFNMSGRPTGAADRIRLEFRAPQGYLETKTAEFRDYSEYVSGYTTTSLVGAHYPMDEVAYLRDIQEGKTVETFEFSLDKEVIKEVFGLATLTDTAYMYIEHTAFFNGKPPSSKIGEWNKCIVSDSVAAEIQNIYNRGANDYPNLVVFGNEKDIKPSAKISTNMGASLRISNPTGLRFYTQLDKTYLDNMLGLYGDDNVTVGTLIAPEVYVKEAGAFTHEALGKLTYETKYLDIPSKGPYRTEDTYTYVGSVTNIKEMNLDLKFAAIGYITVNGKTTYSPEYAVRSVSEVAISALKDTRTASTDKYRYAMLVGGETVYSPYKESARYIINKHANWADDPYGDLIQWSSSADINKPVYYFDILSTSGKVCEIYYAAEYQSYAEQIAAAINKKAGVTIAKVSSTYTNTGNAAIFIGKTGNTTVDSYIDDIKYNDFGFELIANNTLVVGAGKSQNVEAAVALLLESIENRSLLTEKDSGGTVTRKYISSDFDNFYKASYSIENLSISGSNVSDYVIVYLNGNDAAKTAAEALQIRIAETTGQFINVVSSSASAVTKEILVGNITGRGVTYTKNGNFADDDCGMIVTGNKLALVGSNWKAIDGSYNYFCDTYLPYDDDDATVSISSTHTNVFDMNELSIPERADGSTLRIVSNNIKMLKGLTTSVATERFNDLISAYQHLDADIIALQEVDAADESSAATSWYGKGLTNKLGELGYTKVATTAEYHGANIRNPIYYDATKVELIDKGYEYYDSLVGRVSSMANTNYTSSSMGYNWAVFKEILSGNKFVVMSTHLPADAYGYSSKEEAREICASQLVQKVEVLEATYNCPVLVMGDFNSTVTSKEYAMIDNSLLIPARRAARTSSNLEFVSHINIGNMPSKGNAIDHIFYSESGIVGDHYRVLVSPYTWCYSDHVPTMLDFHLTGAMNSMPRDPYVKDIDWDAPGIMNDPYVDEKNDVNWQFPKQAEEELTPVVPKSVDLKLLSNNIKISNSASSAELLKTAYAKLDADILALQEADDNWHETLNLDGLLAKLGYAMVPVPESFKSDIYGTDDTQSNRNPIYYNTDKFELLEYGRKLYDASSFPGATSGGSPLYGYRSYSYTWALLKEKSTGLRVVVIGTHLNAIIKHDGATQEVKDSEAEYRRLSAIELGEAMKNFEDKYNCPVVAVGDYNSTPDTEAYKALESQFNSARTSATTTVNMDIDTNSKGKIDHCFYTNKGITGNHFETIINSGEINISYSDHLPIYFEFTLGEYK